jgi:hypothetical protein
MTRQRVKTRKSAIAAYWLGTDEGRARLPRKCRHDRLGRTELLRVPDAPHNLVLLCRRCHSEAPDVADDAYMLRWIAEHESWGALLSREVLATFKRLDVTEADIELFNDLIPETMIDFTRTVWREFGIPVAGRFTYSTLAACAVESVRRLRDGSPPAAGET